MLRPEEEAALLSTSEAAKKPQETKRRAVGPTPSHTAPPSPSPNPLPSYAPPATDNVDVGEEDVLRHAFVTVRINDILLSHPTELTPLRSIPLSDLRHYIYVEDRFACFLLLANNEKIVFYTPEVLCLV